MTGSPAERGAVVIDPVHRPSRAARIKATAVAGLAAASTLSAAAPPASAADACPNAALRTGASARLPDCRAYEQVSLRDKPSANGTQNAFQVGSALGWARGDGDAVAMSVAAGAMAPDAERGVPNPVVASRTADGWQVRTAFGGPYGPYTLLRSAFKQMLPSDDLTGFAFTSDLRYSTDEPPAVDNISNGGVYRSGPGGIDWLSRPSWAGTTPRPPGSIANGLFEVVGGASDLSSITFTSRLLMAPQDAAAGRQAGASWALYRNDGTAIASASRLPDGTVDPGGAVPAGFLPFDGTRWSGTETEWTHTVSRDGHSALFVSPDPAGPDAGVRSPQLYRSVDGAPSTRLSAPQGGSGAAGVMPVAGAFFAAASADHRFVFFASDDPLTADVPGADAGARKVYRYDTASGTLRYLAEMSVPEVGAGQPGGLLALSDDGRRAVFVTGTALKLWKDDGTVQAITGPGVEWKPGGEARFSPDGGSLAIVSGAPLSDPAGLPDPDTGSFFPDKALNTVFRYDVATGVSRCLSCSAPGQENVRGQSSYLADTNTSDAGLRRPRSFTADGRSLFFSTTAALTAEDRNTVSDVYEDRDGTVRLLSGGRPGSRPAYYTDNSDDGRDVFFATSDALVPGDEDALVDLYDARAGGGFAQAAPPAAPCAGDACQGVPSPPRPAGTAASATSAPEGGAPRPGRTTPRTTLKVKAAKATRSGVRLDLTTSGAGRLRATGSGLAPAARSFAQRGTYRLQVGLSAAARRTLARRGRVKVTVHVRFTPTFGAAASATTTLTVHRATR